MRLETGRVAEIRPPRRAGACGEAHRAESRSSGELPCARPDRPPQAGCSGCLPPRSHDRRRKWPALPVRSCAWKRLPNTKADAWPRVAARPRGRSSPAAKARPAQPLAGAPRPLLCLEAATTYKDGRPAPGWLPSPELNGRPERLATATRWPRLRQPASGHAEASAFPASTGIGPGPGFRLGSSPASHGLSGPAAPGCREPHGLRAGLTSWRARSRPRRSCSRSSARCSPW